MRAPVHLHISGHTRKGSDRSVEAVRCNHAAMARAQTVLKPPVVPAKRSELTSCTVVVFSRGVAGVAGVASSHPHDTHYYNYTTCMHYGAGRHGAQAHQAQHHQSAGRAQAQSAVGVLRRSVAMIPHSSIRGHDSAIPATCSECPGGNSRGLGVGPQGSGSGLSRFPRIQKQSTIHSGGGAHSHKQWICRSPSSK